MSSGKGPPGRSPPCRDAINRVSTGGRIKILTRYPRFYMVWGAADTQFPGGRTLFTKTMYKNKTDFLKKLKKLKVKKPIMDAYEAVDQRHFFDAMFRDRYYGDEPLPLGFGETSDPFVSQALMLNRLAPQKKWRVLEVGTGSGYSTSLLAHLTEYVVSIEINEDLALVAKRNLAAVHVSNVRLFAGDGTEANPKLGQFDAVVVWAACIKRPVSLISRVRYAGRMVFPMGPPHQQQISLLINQPKESTEELFQTTFHEMCLFTPLYGMFGIG
ncbi:MAG: protein-L-isoaspartate O-methyltransferase [Spirochaetes bacterium]|nr:MAG: protein-L-isoaspartate O-methyltransferase [Spirochaetota bacterium]